MNWPEAEAFPDTDVELPYFLVGDDAFPLRTEMMKPYSQRNLSRDQRIFNYRCSRARRVVENAFGILVHVWRCLTTTLQLKVSTCIKVYRIILSVNGLSMFDNFKLHYNGTS